MRGLTDRQRYILTVIEDHIRQRGVPPTIREIMEATGIGSTNGVADHLWRLRQKGYLEPAAKGTDGKAQARSLRLSGDPHCHFCGLPGPTYTGPLTTAAICEPCTSKAVMAFCLKPGTSPPPGLPPTPPLPSSS